MKIAILSVSSSGKTRAIELKSKLDADPTIINVELFHGNVKQALVEIFHDFDAIIGIMALGIMVRISCCLFKSKLTDPALIVIDDAGNNVISLLSGHYGGANQLTQKIASLIDSNPVITTSTDVNGLIGIDELARMFHLKIINPEMVLKFNSAILNNQRIHLFSSHNDLEYLFFNDKIKNKIKKSYLKDNKPSKMVNEIIQSGYFQKNDILATIENENSDLYMILRPKKLVIGVGSRKGISKDHIINSIQSAANILNIPLDRFEYMATAEVKRDEKGILEASEELDLSLEIVSMDQIRDFQSDQIQSSDFVKETFGVKGVCEPVSMLTAGNGSKLIFKKTSFNGVTIAVAVSSD